jgi:hypothetical protein
VLDQERGHPLLAQADRRLDVGEDGLGAGQCASSSAASWLVAATRISTRSSRVRTTVRSARVSSGYGTAGASRWQRSRRYPAITAASPASDLAPDSTSPSRQALIAFGLTDTTGWPASSSRPASRPSGRSIATAECATVNWAAILPAESVTQTA